MRLAFSTIILFSAIFEIALAQQQTNCSSANHTTLDFWVGKWSVSWEGGSGTNEITKEYHGCVIRENFKGSNLKGMSISSYVPATDTWRQIWVDEENGFLDLKGKKSGENYIFHTTPNSSKPNIQLQMVFANITENSFLWTWQRTDDHGENWQNLWQINYKRIE